MAITTNILVTFNESMNTISVQNAFSISPSKTGIFSWSIANKTITFNPDTNLAYGTTYTVTISKTAKDIFGVNLTDDFSWFFKTIPEGNGNGNGNGNGPEPEPNEQPIADAGGPYTGFVDAPITFDGSGSSDSDGTITNYTWDFGDNTIGYGVNPTHSYSNIRNYTVNLQVVFDDNADAIFLTSIVFSYHNIRYIIFYHTFSKIVLVY